jgi:hypothetical protein
MMLLHELIIYAPFWVLLFQSHQALSTHEHNSAGRLNSPGMQHDGKFHQGKKTIKDHFSSRLGGPSRKPTTN